MHTCTANNHNGKLTARQVATGYAVPSDETHEPKICIIDSTVTGYKVTLIMGWTKGLSQFLHSFQLRYKVP